MPPIPLLNGRKVVRVFEQLGWQVVRQRGSHIIMVKWFLLMRVRISSCSRTLPVLLQAKICSTRTKTPCSVKV